MSGVIDTCRSGATANVQCRRNSASPTVAETTVAGEFTGEDQGQNIVDIGISAQVLNMSVIKQGVIVRTKLRLGYVVLASVFMAAMAGFGSGAGAQTVVNGRNVTSIVTTDDTTIRLEPVAQWKEVAKDGKVLGEFKESIRDDWSVYLHDATRHVDLQIDLNLKKVVLTDSNKKKLDLYAVKTSTAEVNGRNVIAVGDETKLRMTGPKAWAEGGTDVSNFVEQSRDDWSVFIMDPHRKLSFQLDLFKKKIMIQQDGKPYVDWAPIATASAMGSAAK